MGLKTMIAASAVTLAAGGLALAATPAFAATPLPPYPSTTTLDLGSPNCVTDDVIMNDPVTGPDHGYRWWRRLAWLASRLRQSRTRCGTPQTVQDGCSVRYSEQQLTARPPGVQINATDNGTSMGSRM